MSSTTFNILIGVAGATAAVAALDRVRGGLADVSGEAAKGAASSAGLGEIATVAGIAATAIGGLKSAIHMGDELRGLSDRTGQSIRDLVIMRQALDSVGIGGGNTAMLINRLQRALGGLNEMGQSTDQAFIRLGVSAASLKDVTALQQWEAISKGFEKIENPAERTAIAMQLFGRDGAEMLKLFADSSALSTAAEDAQDLGDRMQRNAVTFDDVGDRLELMKLRLADAAAAGTEQLLPFLDMAGKAIKAINVSGIGTIGGAALPFAVAAGIAVKSIELLERSLPAWQKKLEGTVFSGVGSGIKSLSGMLATILPYGLAAAVTAAIVSGVVAGIVEADKRQIEEENRKARERHARIKAVSDARSTEDQDKVIAEMQKKLDELNKLEKTQVLQKETTRIKPLAGIAEIVPAKYGLTAEQSTDREQLQRDIAAATSAKARERVAINQATDDENARLLVEKELLTKLLQQADAYEQQKFDAQYSLSNETEKLAMLEDQRQAAEARFAAEDLAAQHAGDQKAIAAASAHYQATLLAIALKRKEVEGQIAEQAKKDEEERQKQAKEALRLKLDLARNDLELRQLEISHAQGLLEADYSRTDAEKWAERLSLNQQALAAAQKYLEKMKEIRDQTAEGDRAGADANVRNAQKDVAGAQGKIDGMGADPFSFNAQMVSMTTTSMNTIGTLAQQMGRMWGSVGESVRTNMGATLADMVLKTGSAGDKIKAFGGAIVTSFVQNGTQMVADWLYSHLIMANIRRIFEASSTAETAAGAAARGGVRSAETAHAVSMTGVQVGTHVAGEGAKTGSTALGAIGRGAIRLGETIFHGVQVALRVAAHLAGEIAQTAITAAQLAIRLPLIMLETMASLVKAAMGALAAIAAIPVVGPVLAIAAMGAVFAAGAGLVGSIGGHKDGGLVSGGQQLTWINEDGEEFVFSAPAVRNLGASRLAAMHDAAKTNNLSAFDSLAAGAAPAAGVASSESGDRSIQLAITALDTDAQIERYLMSRRGQRFVANLRTGQVRSRS